MLLTRNGRDKIEEAVEKKMIRALRISQRKAPVDTGRLRSSLTYVNVSDQDKIRFLLGTNVQYSGFVEFGTEFMAPQPYLRPGLRQGFHQ